MEDMEYEDPEMMHDWNAVERRSGTLGLFAVGLLCGAAAGAAVALLYAPKPGTETRRQVSDSAQRLKRRASEAYDGASHAVGDVLARSRRAVEVGRETFRKARPDDERTAPATVTTP
jgi:YtxH-like protein